MVAIKGKNRRNLLFTKGSQSSHGGSKNRYGLWSQFSLTPTTKYSVRHFRDRNKGKENTWCFLLFVAYDGWKILWHAKPPPDGPPGRWLGACWSRNDRNGRRNDLHLTSTLLMAERRERATQLVFLGQDRVWYYWCTTIPLLLIQILANSKTQKYNSIYEGEGGGGNWHKP